MQTPREIFLEAIHGGQPERFLKQFEAMPPLMTDPFNATNPMPLAPTTETLVDLWGVTWRWPIGTPGAFPLHDETHIVLKDIEHWRDYVKAPSLEFSDAVWAAAKKSFDDIDHTRYFGTPLIFPGIFEQTHNLMGIENALMAYYTDPDEMHELVDFIADWEVQYIRLMGEHHLAIDCVFHHDDWGSAQSTFMSPDMFREFFLEPYRRVYQAYRDIGCQVIVHHSDSYAATLIPLMIDMGIDVWQGGTFSNDIPALVKEYGGRISFMTGIDSMLVDEPNWTREKIAASVREICTACGPRYFIPCQTQGGAESTYPEVYGVIDEEIDKLNHELFPEAF